MLSIVVGAAPLLVAATGATLVIVTRQIDVSIGSQFSLCAVSAGMLVSGGAPFPLAMLAAVVLGALLGLANGLLVGVMKLPAIVATLGTMVIWRELLRWWRGGEFVHDLPAGFQWFGLSQGAGQAAVVVGALALWGAVALGARFTHPGRDVFLVGSNPEAARLLGLRPTRVVVGVFVLSGATAALAAVLGSVRFGDIDPGAGAGLELRAIAAAVVGGAAVSGGRASMVGVLLGAVLLSIIGPALVFLGVQPQWERVIQGLIILVAVGADASARQGRA
ncbi:MAG: ABC transporter permease [Phycisphaerae bacterium]|nr:ABC transporter permease [Phycisphaerae bacterium]